MGVMGIALLLAHTPWPLSRKRIVPTGRPPLVGEIAAKFFGSRVSRGQRNESLRPLISVFQTGAATRLFKQLRQPHSYTQGRIENEIESVTICHLYAQLWPVVRLCLLCTESRHIKTFPYSLTRFMFLIADSCKW
jgi:hypothetical protein